VLNTEGRDLLPQSTHFFRMPIGGAEGTTQSTQVNVYVGLFAFFGVSGRDRACEMTELYLYIEEGA